MILLARVFTLGLDGDLKGVLCPGYESSLLTRGSKALGLGIGRRL